MDPHNTISEISQAFLRQYNPKKNQPLPPQANSLHRQLDALIIRGVSTSTAHCGPHAIRYRLITQKHLWLSIIHLAKGKTASSNDSIKGKARLSLRRNNSKAYVICLTRPTLKSLPLYLLPVFQVGISLMKLRPASFNYKCE